MKITIENKTALIIVSIIIITVFALGSILTVLTLLAAKNNPDDLSTVFDGIEKIIRAIKS